VVKTRRKNSIKLCFCDCFFGAGFSSSDGGVDGGVVCEGSINSVENLLSTFSLINLPSVHIPLIVSASGKFSPLCPWASGGAVFSGCIGSINSVENRLSIFLPFSCSNSVDGDEARAKLVKETIFPSLLSKF
jgi:hypothetical protein